MRHCYLILAHSEFDVLIRLIDSLDDERNDIYLHYDAKVNELPLLNVEYANLHILENRVDVSWGDVSMLAAEFNLFEAATRQNKYAYYHLLSGVDMPIKSQDFIHEFFAIHNGKEFIGYTQGDVSAELYTKVQLYHLYPKSFRKRIVIFDKFKVLIRSLLVAFQKKIGYMRYKGYNFKKGPQWLSVTHEFVVALLEERSEILRRYKFTFCSDEIFVQSFCWNSLFKDRLYSLKNAQEGCQRLIGWQDNQIIDWKLRDFDRLMGANALFARKFSSKNIEIVDKIAKQIK